MLTPPLRALVPKYHLADQIKEDGGACGTHEMGQTILQRFGEKARRKETIRKIEA
jgi:hypothetical protein